MSPKESCGKCVIPVGSAILEPLEAGPSWKKWVTKDTSLKVVPVPRCFLGLLLVMWWAASSFTSSSHAQVSSHWGPQINGAQDCELQHLKLWAQINYPSLQLFTPDIFCHNYKKTNIVPNRYHAQILNRDRFGDFYDIMQVAKVECSMMQAIMKMHRCTRGKTVGPTGREGAECNL